jgi:hypothetical protein
VLTKSKSFITLITGIKKGESIMNLQQELNKFNGTENYYRHGLTGILFTDGIKFLCDEAEAYWLIDVIGSHQFCGKIKDIPFQLWELELTGNGGCKITMKQDSDQPNEVIQHIEYTTFPMQNIKLWLQNNVLYLPSEH